MYRSDSRRVLATLIRLVGDFDLAEEALHEAFAAAVEQWPRDGLPANPRAWLVSAGRFKAIDVLRRRARFDASLAELARQLETRSRAVALDDEPRGRPPAARLHLLPPGAAARGAGRAHAPRGVRPDDRGDRARILTAPPTVAQRIVRAKAKIRDARHSLSGARRERSCPSRLEAVLHVVYLVFNEGYSASSGASLTRHDLSAEAIRLGRLLVELLPEPEAIGLLALMLLQESRRAARTAERRAHAAGDQDRSLWNRAADRRRTGAGRARARITAVRTVLAAGRDCRGPCRSSTAAATDWAQIVGLYDVLMQAEPSPVVELNRAVAVAMRDGPAAGLASSTRFSRAAIWPTITWPTPPGPTSPAAGRREARASTKALALSSSRSPNAASSSVE